MRINRNPALYTYRRSRRRQRGCLPFTLLSGILIATLLLSWGWISDRLSPPPAPGHKDLTPARELFDRGALEQSIAAARMVYEANPDRTDALWLLVRALIYQSYTDYNTTVNRDIALQLTSAAISRTPTDSETLSIHAFALHANGEPIEAFEAAERVLEGNGQNVLARIVMGLSYGGVGAYDTALQQHQATLKRLSGDDPLMLEMMRALAISYSDLGRYEEAAQTVEKAIAINHRLPVLYFERALYALQTGDASQATEAYFAVLAYDTQNVKARLRMCEVSSMMRDRDTALKYCGEVTTLAPTWADGWHKLGREYFLQGNFTEAQNALNRCSSLQVMLDVPVSQRRFECWYLQGQAAEINGDCPALLATYNEFRAMNAEYPIPQTWVYPPEGPAICISQSTLSN